MNSRSSNGQDPDLTSFLMENMHYAPKDQLTKQTLENLHKKLAFSDPYINFVVHCENQKIKKANQVDPYNNNNEIQKQKRGEILSIDYDSTSDFRALGKSTQSVYDHSKFSCILPATSLRQKTQKIQYLMLTQPELYNSLQANTNNQIDLFSTSKNSYMNSFINNSAAYTQVMRSQGNRSMVVQDGIQSNSSLMMMQNSTFNHESPMKDANQSLSYGQNYDINFTQNMSATRGYSQERRNQIGEDFQKILLQINNKKAIQNNQSIHRQMMSDKSEIFSRSKSIQQGYYMSKRQNNSRTSQQQRLLDISSSSNSPSKTNMSPMPIIKRASHNQSSTAKQSTTQINRTFDNSYKLNQSSNGINNNINQSFDVYNDIESGNSPQKSMIKHSFQAIKVGKNKMKLQPIDRSSSLMRKVQIFQKNLDKQYESQHQNGNDLSGFGDYMESKSFSISPQKLRTASGAYGSPLKMRSVYDKTIANVMFGGNTQQSQTIANTNYNSPVKRYDVQSRGGRMINESSNFNTNNEFENKQKSVSIEITQLAIPEHLQNKVPRHWLTFVEDVVAELKEINLEKYEGGVSKGNKHGQGAQIYSNGDIYKGVFRSDLRHGSGICKFMQTGIIHKGEWREDKMNGMGTVFTPPGEIIEASFTNGKINDGKIKILYSNGEYYEGDFKQNKRNGKGTYYYENGDIYEGDFINDKRLSKGKLQFVDNSTLISQFIDDAADGHGIYEDSDGNSFQSVVADDKDNTFNGETGSIRNGRLFNMAKVKYKNDDKYKGLFNDGRPSKYGEMRYQMSLEGMNGELEGGDYRGEWKGGKRHGKGTMKWDDGSIFEGLWQADQRISGTLKMTNGMIYIGTFKNDRLDGVGCRVIVLATGLIFEGDFKEGLCPQIGKILYPNGNLYFGQHKDFSKDGNGKMVYYSGEIYEGEWENDRKTGKGKFQYTTVQNSINGIGAIYIGEYQDEKRSGKGRFFDPEKDEIYEGEWANDKRNGEGTIIKRSGEVIQADFRNDMMEGRQKYEKTLSKQEVQKYFDLAFKNTETFIQVNTNKYKR
eukprot:403338954